MSDEHLSRLRVVVPVLLVAALAGLGQAQTARGATLQLTGTIRDFNDTHPDFEIATGGNDPGIVKPQLGADGKPEYAPAVSSLTTSGKANFDQWYRDVPGVNMTQSLTIDLDNTGSADPSIYTFSDSDFFPIDGQLLGNQGRLHNYHFTLEVHSRFTYQAGQIFTFTGDDDVWVFINHQRVIDLGGVHAPEQGQVNLDTLGLTVGADYDFDLFFAERHTVMSNFRIDTSIQLQPPPPPTPAMCVCDVTLQQVPQVVIDDALSHPEKYYGWRYLLDPGKPLSPWNPRRECLSLHNPGLAYHPLWNKPEWHVGCP